MYSQHAVHCDPCIFQNVLFPADSECASYWVVKQLLSNLHLADKRRTLVMRCICALHHQVLRAWPVPRDLTAQDALHHGSHADAAKAAWERTPGAAEKQPGSATLNDTASPVERLAADGASSGGAERLGLGHRATEEGFVGPSWGREHAGELEEVVRWCAPRVAWEHLRLQLQVQSASLLLQCVFLASRVACSGAMLVCLGRSSMFTMLSLEDHLRVRGLSSGFGLCSEGCHALRLPHSLLCFLSTLMTGIFTTVDFNA